MCIRGLCIQRMFAVDNKTILMMITNEKKKTSWDFSLNLLHFCLKGTKLERNNEKDGSLVTIWKTNLNIFQIMTQGFISWQQPSTHAPWYDVIFFIMKILGLFPWDI